MRCIQQTKGSLWDPNLSSLLAFLALHVNLKVRHTTQRLELLHQCHYGETGFLWLRGRVSRPIFSLCSTYIIHDCADLSSFLLFLAKGEVPASKQLVVENAARRKRIISNIHNANHLGLNRTNEMTVHKYYWPGMFKDVEQYVSLVIDIHFQYC